MKRICMMNDVSGESRRARAERVSTLLNIVACWFCMVLGGPVIGVGWSVPRCSPVFSRVSVNCAARV